LSGGCLNRAAFAAASSVGATVEKFSALPTDDSGTAAGDIIDNNSNGALRTHQTPLQ
jgi:hypothetical protein